jgi:hypothetical protein
MVVVGSVSLEVGPDVLGVPVELGEVPSVELDVDDPIVGPDGSVSASVWVAPLSTGSLGEKHAAPPSPIRQSHV